MRNTTLTIALGAALAALAPSGEAFAQSINYSKSGARPAQTTQGYAGPAAPQPNAPVIYQPGLASGWPYSYVEMPYRWTSSGFVVDNLVNQQADILKEQANQAKIDTRRQLFDQRRYEQMMTPTYEETRQAELARQYSQARNNPPPQSIWSGSALNNLVYLIRHVEASTEVRGPTVPLPPDLCEHLNFSSGTRTTAGTSMIQGGAKLQWPLALARDEFAESRRIIEKAITEAVRSVQNGSPGAIRSIGEAQGELSNLREGLRLKVRTESAPDYMDAVGYLRSLGEAVDALKEPTAARLLAAPRSRPRPSLS